MEKNVDIFSIKSNDILPDKGKILISEPFLKDINFARSVILLVDHGNEGSMGIIMNKQLSLMVNDVVKEFKYLEQIPLFKGGPVDMDTLFYLHTLPHIKDSLYIGNGVYLNGDFNAIKKYILQGNPIEGNIRFFLGYSGWDSNQLKHEIEENTWFIGDTNVTELLDIKGKDLWKNSLEKLGNKYETWSRFPKNPSLN